MEQQSAYLDLTILSAADLKRNWLSGDQTVAIAWVDSSTKKTTKVTSGGGSNAEWHEKMTLPLNGADALARGKRLTIEIHSRGNWGNTLLGTVYVPLVDLALDGQEGENTILTYQIVQPSGKREGRFSFVAKIVKLMANGSVVPLPSVSPAIPLADNSLGGGFNTSSESFPYSSHQSCLSQNHAPMHDAWQHAILPYPSYGMASHPPQVYPPVNTANPPSAPCTPHSNHSSIEPYPPPASVYPPPASQSSEAPYPPPASIYPPPAWQSSEAPYPPPASVHPPPAWQSSEAPYPPPASVYPPPAWHSSEAPYPPPASQSSEAPYPPPASVHPPPAWHFSEAPYPPPASVYPPPASQSSEAPYPPPASVYPPPASPFSEAPYPPTSLYPPIASHSLEVPYPPTSLYPYPAYPNPSMYPPPYPLQHAPVHRCSPYRAYCGASF